MKSEIKIRLLAKIFLKPVTTFHEVRRKIPNARRISLNLENDLPEVRRKIPGAEKNLPENRKRIL